jgi:hypothetical protein
MLISSSSSASSTTSQLRNRIYHSILERFQFPISAERLIRHKALNDYCMGLVRHNFLGTFVTTESSLFSIDRLDIRH